MEKPAKIFIGGALCAALVAGVGALNTVRLKSNLRALEAKCSEDGKRERERTGLDLRPVCEGETLSELPGQLVGIQGQIATARHDVRNSPAMPGLIAIGLLIVSAIPWTWYFLLRRIRELRDAIVGK